MNRVAKKLLGVHAIVSRERRVFGAGVNVIPLCSTFRKGRKHDQQSYGSCGFYVFIASLSLGVQAHSLSGRAGSWLVLELMQYQLR